MADAKLYDGRVIQVKHHSSNSVELRSPGFFYFYLAKSNFDKHRIEFSHPDTGERIVWDGQRHFAPLLLDFVRGIPYLVVYGRPTKDTERAYGCPELPYVYLRYTNGDWTAVPVEDAPRELVASNLSTYDAGFMNGRRNSVESVESSIQYAETMSHGQLQARIPRTYDEWNTRYKNEARNERLRDDCRPPPKPLPDIELPVPQDVVPEQMETHYWEGDSDRYGAVRRQGGTVARANCLGLFELVDKQNLMAGERFKNDPTGKKKLPFTGPIPVPTGRMLEQRTERYCSSDFVWFIAQHEEAGKTWVTKYTSAGDLVYNVRFSTVEAALPKRWAVLVPDTVWTDDGYFNFYLQLYIPGSKEYRDRRTGFRFKEPF